MELEAEARLTRGFEDFSRFFKREDARLAEHISEARDLLLPHLWEQIVAKEAQEFGALLRAPAVFVRDFVGAEPGGNDAHRRGGGETSDDAQRLELVVDRESVAPLDLDSGRSIGRQRVQAGHRELI